MFALTTHTFSKFKGNMQLKGLNYNYYKLREINDSNIINIVDALVMTLVCIVPSALKQYQPLLRSIVDSHSSLLPVGNRWRNFENCSYIYYHDYG